MNPLVTLPDHTIILPPRLFGSVGYYALMAQFGRVIVHSGCRYDKRAKAVHRYDIVDTRGPVSLTVPLGKPRCLRAATWADVSVSTHDRWWHQHRVTLESAYGRTPFFEFVFDRFAPLFTDPSQASVWPSALDMAQRADYEVRALLGFENKVTWRIPSHYEPAVDLLHADFVIPDMPPYWQIRHDSLGFIPNLSILDLIFNLGPEAAVYLHKIAPSVCPILPPHADASPAGPSLTSAL